MAEGEKKVSKIQKQAEMLRQNLILRKKQVEERAKREAEKKDGVQKDK